MYPPQRKPGGILLTFHGNFLKRHHSYGLLSMTRGRLIIWRIWMVLVVSKMVPPLHCKISSAKQQKQTTLCVHDICLSQLGCLFLFCHNSRKALTFHIKLIPWLWNYFDLCSSFWNARFRPHQCIFLKLISSAKVNTVHTDRPFDKYIPVPRVY